MEVATPSQKKYRGLLREKHGMSGTPIYDAWVVMRQKCYDTNCSAYPFCGGVGIRVCKEWNDSFLAFYNDMGERPEGTKLHRRDLDGHYTPENCYWGKGVQTRRSTTTSRTRYVSVDGKEAIATEVAARNGISRSAFSNRVARGWTNEEAAGVTRRESSSLLTVDGVTKSVSEWAEEKGISRQCLLGRLQRGWSPEKSVNTPVGEIRRQSRLIEYEGESMTVAQWAKRMGMSEQTLRNRLYGVPEQLPMEIGDALTAPRGTTGKRVRKNA